MKAMKFTWTAVLLMAATGALAQAPLSLSPEYVMGNLKKDVTTRAEVIRLFGEPTRRNVRVSSELGSIEYFVYTSNPPEPPKKAKGKRGGLGALLRSARGIAGDVAVVTGHNAYSSETAEALRRAEGVANVADRVAESNTGGNGEMNQNGSNSTLTLTIELRNGVVTSYDMGE